MPRRASEAETGGAASSATVTTSPVDSKLRYNRGMTFILPALAVAFAAFCVWLTVRIVNRRERWTKWTLAAAIGVPGLYILSFGPACWMVDRGNVAARPVAMLYRPILVVILNGPEICRSALTSYGVGGADDPAWLLTRLLNAGGLIGTADMLPDADVPHRTSRP